MQKKSKLMKEHNVIYEMLKNELEDATRKIYKLGQMKNPTTSN